MPALLPPPIPLFSCSTIRTPGWRSRMSSSVPSVEPWSTTTTSWPRTDSRHCSSHGSAFHVTTTTVTSGCSIGHRRAAEHVLPDDDRDTGKRKQDRHHEEDEPACERGVVVDPELPEEADEERLAHADAVDGERHEHDEEEQRTEHDVREQRQIDPDGLPGGVDRDDARELLGGG